MENSIEDTKKQLELMLKVRKEQKEIIECAGGSCMNCDPDIKALSRSIEILSDYKRVLKENEELKQDKINNYQMIALAQNEVLGYMQGYEDGKKLKRSAVACVVENQQYYIIKKEIEHYKECIEKLQKKNEEYSRQLDLDYVDKNYILKKKIEDTIEELKGKLKDISKRREKSKTKEEKNVLWCLEIRTDERIKTLQELL